MTILVFGKTGQVARELAQLESVRCLGRDAADLMDPNNCAAAIQTHAPRAVINAAAYTAVDAAETDEDTAAVVNGDAPRVMAETCAALGIPFVHVSTDYVFDGSGEMPWYPHYVTGPLGAYGRTKLLGESGVRTVGGVHVILRTSWVVSAHGNNFVKTMLRLGGDRDRLTIVADQIGGPTPARAIAQACHDIARQLISNPEKSGTYHLSGTPDCSWADFARAIFEMARVTCDVVDIPSSEYPTPAVRPSNSRLDCTTLTQTFGITRPDWRSGVAEILTQIDQATS